MNGVYVLGTGFAASLALVSVIGCGQPRVYLLTGTLVGLEAKPPMGDSQPNPAVTFGYKRAELALLPVCKVLKSSSTNVGENPGLVQSKDETCLPLSRAKDTNGKSQEDAFSTVALFRLGINWFGPAKIEQFIATGQAARALQKPAKDANKNTAKLAESASRNSEESNSQPPRGGSSTQQ